MKAKGLITPSELTDLLGGITVHGVYKILQSKEIDYITSSSRRKYITPAGVRKLLESRGFEYPKLNISFQIVKGGAGKTSLSYSLGLRASHYGARVLLVDLDMQGNLTRSFKLESREQKVWIDIFREDISAKEAIINVGDGVDLLPSNLNNSRLDLELSSSNINLITLLQSSLADVESNYDLIIFDCPPAINKISTAATCASDLVIIPLNPDPYSMDGLEFTLSELNNIKKRFSVNFDYRIVWNKYDARERLGAIYMHSLAKNSERFEKILPVVIRTDTSFKNSIADSKSIFDLPKKSYAKEDIDQFAKEILGIPLWLESQVKNSNSHDEVIEAI
jgi:chromosome partitioning protein